MRLMALIGIELKSTGAVPRPIFEESLTSAEVCWRLPLISTRTWSGLIPRNCAARTWSAPPELDWRGKLNEGSSACRAWPSSPPIAPVALRSSAVSTSTGTGESSTVRFLPRVPVTSTVSSLVVAALVAVVLVPGVVSARVDLRDGSEHRDGDQ
ncbi:MAG: hypothetical protein GAK45_00771 [Pseudomonas citronellolis]|nr:MAG: hypothetical protein GAK45_00771 [Pseudomonas citronellolis]